MNGNGRQLVLRAGYQTKYQAEMAYGLLRNTKIKDTPQDVQNSRRERLQIRVRTYIELKEKALEVCDCQISLQTLNELVKHLKIFGYYHAKTLLEAIEKD